MKEEIDDFYKEILEEENKIFVENILLLGEIGQIKSEEYLSAVTDCLKESEAHGKLSFVDISTINPKHKQEEDWDEFDHIYVDQQINGGYIGDEYAGYIWIPITEKKYLKSYYSM